MVLPPADSFPRCLHSWAWVRLTPGSASLQSSHWVTGMPLRVRSLAAFIVCVDRNPELGAEPRSDPGRYQCLSVSVIIGGHSINIV